MPPRLPGSQGGASATMGFGQAIAACFGKYAVFSGRARRAEYWWFYLFTILLTIPANILDAAMQRRRDDIGVFGTLVALVLLLPQLAVIVRRLHDTNRSGWWIGAPMLLALPAGVVMAMLVTTMRSDTDGILAMFGLFVIAALIYAIILFIFSVLDGTPGPNKYGPDPKGR